MKIGVINGVSIGAFLFFPGSLLIPVQPRQAALPFTEVSTLFELIKDLFYKFTSIYPDFYVISIFIVTGCFVLGLLGGLFGSFLAYKITQIINKEFDDVSFFSAMKSMTHGFFGTRGGLLFAYLGAVFIIGFCLIGFGFYLPEKNNVKIFCQLFGFIILIYGGGSLAHSLFSGREEMGSTTILSSCPHCHYEFSIYEIPFGPDKLFSCPNCNQKIKTN